MSSVRFPAVVDEVTVRLIAGVVLVLAGVALVTHQWWLYAVLAVDFGLRAGLGPKVSPIALAVQRWVRPRVAVDPRPTAGPPKRFAAAIGAVMTAAATVLWLVSAVSDSGAATAAVLAIGAIMVLFPALEAVAGLCVGCQVFALLMRVGVIPDEVCVECADITKRVRTSASSTA
jgi:hypothetical protein